MAKKKQIKVVINAWYELETRTFDELRHDMQKIEQDNPQETGFYFDRAYDDFDNDESYHYQVMAERLETDKEFEKRQKTAKKARAQRKLQKQLEKQKQKTDLLKQAKKLGITAQDLT